MSPKAEGDVIGAHMPFAKKGTINLPHARKECKHEPKDNIKPPRGGGFAPGYSWESGVQGLSNHHWEWKRFYQVL